MSAGSAASEGDDDHQCRHCGRWYSRAGLGAHERHCDWSQSEKRMHDLVDPLAVMRVDDVGLEEIDADGDDVDPASTPPNPGPNPGPDPADGPGPDPDRDPSPSPTRTDGGPSAVPDDWSSDDVGGAGADRETVDVDLGNDSTGCPSCGSTDSRRIDDLPDEVLEAEPALRQYDRYCSPCSTDVNGTLTSTLEVFEA